MLDRRKLGWIGEGQVGKEKVRLDRRRLGWIGKSWVK